MIVSAMLQPTGQTVLHCTALSESEFCFIVNVQEHEENVATEFVQLKFNESVVIKSWKKKQDAPACC